MPTYEALSNRIQVIVEQSGTPFEVKKMFGGVALMVADSMACGVTKSGDLMVRVRTDKYTEALTQPGAREMDFTGRPMKGFLFIDPKYIEREEDLRSWLEMGIEFAQTEGSKSKKRK